MRVLWLVNIPLPPVRARQGLPPLPYGGWLSSTLSALVSEAPDLHVVCASREWSDPVRFECDGVEYVTVPRMRPEVGWHGVVSKWTGREERPALESEMRQLIADVQPDLVHLHGTEDPHALAMLRAAGSVPLLVSVQGLVSELVAGSNEGLSPADLFRDVASVEFLKGRGFVQSRRRWKHVAARELETLAKASDVSGRTDWDRDAVLRANPMARYWHIDEVLRQPFYQVTWRGPTDSVPTIIAVTGPSSNKGIDVLLRAFARIRDRRDCRLRIVGQIEGTPLWPSLQRLEAQLGLTGEVDWAGERSATEVAAMLSMCSVAVCASRLENSSNSVCEAMLVGAPVVASRAGGIPSLLTHEEDGLLFEVGDDQALAGAALAVLDDDHLARRLGARARITASARHDPSSVAKRLLEVYAALVSGGRA